MAHIEPAGQRWFKVLALKSLTGHKAPMDPHLNFCNLDSNIYSKRSAFLFRACVLNFKSAREGNIFKDQSHASYVFCSANVTMVHLMYPLVIQHSY